MPAQSISLLNLQVLQEAAALAGVTWQHGQPAASLDEAEAPWVSSEVLDAAYRSLMQATGRSDLGLMLACSPVLARIGILPMLLMHAPNLATVLDHIRQYCVLIQEAPEFTVDDDAEADTVTLRFKVMHHSPEGLVCRFEFVALGLTQILRLVGQGDAGLLALDVPYAPPPHAVLYAQHFDGPVRFDQPEGRLVFRRAWMARSIYGADPLLYGAVLQRANLALAARRRQDGLVAQVSQVLASRLHLRPTMADVADALGLTARTLRRRLSQLGIDYLALQQQMQQQRAQSLLAAGERSIQQIAADVGFASTPAFHRAFLRWTGDTPRGWQAKGPH